MKIIREEENGIITVEEYVLYKQPEVYAILKNYRRYVREQKVIEFARRRVQDITEEILKAASVEGKDRFYDSIMKERPKPGRGGLLSGEKEKVLMR